MLNVFAYHHFQARTWFQTYRLNRPGLSLSSPPAKMFTQASFLLLVTFVLKSGQMRSQVLPSGIYCPGWPPSVGFLEKHKCKSGSWGKRAIFLPYFHHFLPNSQEIPYQSVRKEGDKVLHTILCLAGHLEIVRPMTYRFQSPAVSLLDVTSAHITIIFKWTPMFYKPIDQAVLLSRAEFAGVTVLGPAKAVAKLRALWCCSVSWKEVISFRRSKCFLLFITPP